jgi:hypothetical protein
MTVTETGIMTVTLPCLHFIGDIIQPAQNVGAESIKTVIQKHEKYFIWSFKQKEGTDHPLSSDLSDGLLCIHLSSQ